MRPTRVLLVILHADPSRGGAERYTVDLSAALAARGHGVKVLATSFAPEVPAAARVEVAARGSTRVRRYRRFLAGLSRHVAAERYDIVHAMLPVPGCDVYHPHAGLAAEAVTEGSALNRLRRRFNPRRQAFATIESALLAGPRPPVVLCLSGRMKSHVRTWFDLPDDRLAVLFNAVDLEKFDPARRPDAGAEVRRRLGLGDGPLALIVAQDFGRKGVREAMAAVGGIAGARLVVVGRPDAGPYRRLARAGGHADRITFAGPTDDVYAYYAAADLFVLPTRRDPCSLVVLEALAMGVPVVTTRQNGASEIMADGVHGAVLDDPADAPALRAAVAGFLEPDRNAAARAACLALRPALAYERHLRTLEAIYQRTHSTEQAGV